MAKSKIRDELINEYKDQAFECVDKLREVLEKLRPIIGQNALDTFCEELEHEMPM